MSESVLCVRHDELDEATLEDIVAIKSEHWAYPAESQKKWIRENIKADDLHLIVKEDCDTVAYLSICNVELIIDGKKENALGIGSVCVSKKYLGMGKGKRIVLLANEQIKKKNGLGVLLCHDALVDFYRRCNWGSVYYDKAVLAEKDFNDNIMLLQDFDIRVKEIIIDRNF